jgi:uncharacterized protein YrrD
LRTFSLLKEVPVYDKNVGKKLGTIKDLCLNTNGNIEGLVLDPKGWFSRQAVIPIHCISSFGYDGIMVNDEAELKKYFTDDEFLFTHPQKGIYGKPLLSAEGEKLGIVEDVYFNEELGTIVGYEVTEGFFADLKEGRKVVKTEKPLVFGKDVLFVHMK